MVHSTSMMGMKATEPSKTVVWAVDYCPKDGLQSYKLNGYISCVEWFTPIIPALERGAGRLSQVKATEYRVFFF